MHRAIVIGAVCLFTSCAAFGALRFDIESLGVVESQYDFVFAHGINNSAAVVGEVKTRSGTRAFLWRPHKGMRRLDGLGGRKVRASAQAISDAGVAVGASGQGRPFEPDRAVRWVPLDGLQDLGALASGSGLSTARAVNDAGEVAGTSSAGDADQAFLWTHKAALRPIGQRWEADASRALGLNDAGTVVGYLARHDGNRAFRWAGDEAALLPLPDNAQGSVASAINNRGEAVGRIRKANGEVEAALWAAGGIAYLGALGESDYAEALAISDRGWVVGRSIVNGRFTAFLRTPQHGLRRLTALIPKSDTTRPARLFAAVGINEAHQIIAFGKPTPGAPTRSYLLEPTRPARIGSAQNAAPATGQTTIERPPLVGLAQRGVSGSTKRRGMRTGLEEMGLGLPWWH